METLTHTTIKSVLIANRGEIASRVMRTCSRMGIETIAVYSDADRYAPFVREADQAVHIGEPEASKSYLDQDKVIAAARRTGADAIHPGYGFLSENAAFAQRCQDEGILFIGPHPKAIEAMGSKSGAKKIMEDSGVPVVPGYRGSDQSEECLISEALKVGFPLLLKATAGGGGKGMRIVRAADELSSAISSAKREAQSAFGDDELLIEKYVASGRHIEFQIFGDKHGNAIHLLERECTIQRRYQKVIEESPSPVMDDALRTTMGAAAVKAAKALKYDNAGTVEFIYDDLSGEFHFLEVNTRLQVEHPVTECITGLDLVQMQIESASGLPLRLSQEEVKGTGYAIEARLYAEDPSNDFLPVTGKVHRFGYPEVEGLRMESAVQSGSEITIYYDPMIAKVVLWDQTREAAQAKLHYVLKHMICQGTVTNLMLLQKLCENSDFKAGNYDTHFIDNKMEASAIGILPGEAIHEACIAATLFNWQQREKKRTLLKSLPSGWRNNFYQHQKQTFRFAEDAIEVAYRYVDGAFLLMVEGQERRAAIESADEETISITLDGLRRRYSVFESGKEQFVHTPSCGNVRLLAEARFPEVQKEKVGGGYEAPMPSQIVQVKVTVGDRVSKGDPLMIISSMKMENTLTAQESGTVEEIFVSEGQNVEAGFLLLTLNANEI